jgi:hypothetical protein
MAIEASGSGIILAVTNAVAGREAEFNKWYDEVHVKDLVAVPGIGAAQRYRVVAPNGMPAPPYEYLTIYRADVSPDAIFANLAATRDTRAISDSLAPGGGLWGFEAIGPRVTG